MLTARTSQTARAQVRLPRHCRQADRGEASLAPDKQWAQEAPRWRLLPNSLQWANTGLPLASLISAAQVFWTSATTLAGIGT